MKARLLILLCVAPLLAVAQEKTFDIGVSYGGYTSTIGYHPNQFKNYFSADFDYHLKNRWTISSGFMAGTFGYYDSFPVKLADGTYSEKPNSQGYDFHGYAMAKYAIVATPRFSLQVGAGAGLYTQRLVYTYYEAAYAADFEVPILVEGYYLVAGKVGIGAKAGGFMQGGSFMQPEMRGIYVGPQIRVRL